MAETCDCGDQECAICCGRPRKRTQYVDPYLAAKAEQERAAQQVPANPARVAQQAAEQVVQGTQFTVDTASFDKAAAHLEQPLSVVQVETPPVAQLAQGWTPPTVAEPEAPQIPPHKPAQSESAIAELAGIATAQAAPARPQKQQTPFARAYTLWQQECTKRNQWINSKLLEYQSRMSKRAIAIAQWDAHVLEAKKDWQAAKATLPPPAPRREDFPS